MNAPTTPGADLAIRLRRAAFNRALAEANLAAIKPILAPYAVVVTGTDSAVRTDRNAQLAIWKANFAAKDRAIYTRLPDTITVSTVEPIAMEHGRWEGVMAATGEVFASGAYTAKWRQMGADWVIEAEIYLTLA
ncbi:MAG: nuclear transport factor 2 family protein [Sphingomonas sp.]